VNDFNAAVRPGTFDDTILDDCRTEGITPAKTHWARRIETAPYLAYPVRPGITFTYLATRVNKEARMLMRDGKPSAKCSRQARSWPATCLGAVMRRHRHDHRQRVRPHRGQGGGQNARN